MGGKWEGGGPRVLNEGLKGEVVATHTTPRSFFFARKQKTGLPREEGEGEGKREEDRADSLRVWGGVWRYQFL